MTHTEKRSNRKLIVLCLLLVLLLAATAFGTMAWLTASSSVTNTFTVGNFNKPDPDPADPSDPEHPLPDPDATVTDPMMGGYLYEPSWSLGAEHKLVPGGSLDKDPYVGIGKDSEDAIVYVYVENPFLKDSVYFTLNAGWEPVTDYVTKVDGDNSKYISGLFKYSGVLEASETADVWTSAPVFSSVVVAQGATVEDLNPMDDGQPIAQDIVVSCYIHQAYDGSDTEKDNMLATAALEGAKKWVATITGSATEP